MGLGWSMEGRTSGDNRGIGSVPFWQRSDADAEGATAEGGGLGGNKRGQGARLWRRQLKDRRNTQSSLWTLITKPGNVTPVPPVSSIFFFFFSELVFWICNVSVGACFVLFSFFEGFRYDFKEDDYWEIRGCLTWGF